MSNQELRYLIKNELEYAKYINNKDVWICRKIYNKYKKIIDVQIQVLNIPVNEKIYWFINNITKMPKCCYCGNSVSFTDVRRGYHNTCSIKCASNLEEVKTKRKQTNLKRYGSECNLNSVDGIKKKKETWILNYGTDNPSKSNIIKQKKKVTSFKNYGVENPQKSDQVKEKAKKTNIKKYGKEFAVQSKEIQDKIKKTNIERYGSSNPWGSKQIIKKSKQTIFNIYGVENCSQSDVIQSKKLQTSFSTKNYTMPSGDIRKVQGYESFALDILLEKYKEDDIITDDINIPEIWYIGLDNKSHRYYPDIYIKSENKLIEVKSTWTYDMEKETNLLKQKASTDYGYKHEIWIIDKGKLIQTIFN